jgi:hypothetical protein
LLILPATYKSFAYEEDNDFMSAEIGNHNPIAVSLWFAHRNNMAFSGINCSMDEEYNNDIKDLKQGDTVTVKGICSGLLLDVILTRCVVVK